MIDLRSNSSALQSAGKPGPRFSSVRGLTLVEVIYSIALVTLFTGGVLAAMMFSRRLSEQVVRQNIAVEIAQGYSEQMKNMAYADLILSPKTSTELAANLSYYVLKTQKDEATTDFLNLSAGSPPALSAVNAATDTCTNTRSIPVNPANNLSLNMDMKFWVWVNDVSTEGTSQIKLVTIIYAFKIQDGRRSRWFTAEVRSMKSIIPTF